MSSISQVDSVGWNSLCQDGYPFIRHEFLMALESSGSVDEVSGWIPNHLVVYLKDELVGFLPLYQKTHSYGEYVFDHSWANAYHQNGIHYFPKLVSAIPFTPCAGPRLMIKPMYQQELMPQVIEQVKTYCNRNGFSSWHLLFPDLEREENLEQSEQPNLENKLLKRTGLQYHWYNQNYQSFDDFLNQCKQKKRKNIRRERKTIQEANVELEFVEGREATGPLWAQFFEFYQRTYLKRSGNRGYLNWGFFEFIANAMPDNLVLAVAKYDQQVIGMSLFFKGADTLYGRYWGASAEYEFLHFEACYYQGIEYCIKHGLKHFDAGAQGEHKIPRGFKPIKTFSYHWIENPQFREAIASFLIEEVLYVEQAIDELTCRLPFKSE